MQIEIKKNQIRVFVIDISEITEEEFRNLLNVQSEQIRTEIGKYVNHIDKLHALYSFLLKKRYGDKYFSVSHSNSVCAIALSNKPVGFDVQYHVPKKNFATVASRVMCECRVKTLKQFYNCWAIKEASIKCYGGEPLPMIKDVKVDPEFAVINNTKFHYWARSFSNYCFAIASAIDIIDVQIAKIKNLP